LQLEVYASNLELARALWVNLMKTEELKQWKIDLTKDRQKELDAVGLKYDRKLAAIEVLLEDDVASIGGLRSTKSKPPPREPSSLGDEFAKTVNKLGATKEAVAQFKGGRFTTAKLFEYVKSKYPNVAEKPSDLSNSVWVLKKSDDIKIVKEGAGPDSPPEYIVTENFKFP
jgi:hypothetical protein